MPQGNPMSEPDTLALLNVVLGYKSEFLDKQPKPEQRMSYFHLPFDDARTTATMAQRGAYSSLTSARELSSPVQVYNTSTFLGPASYQGLSTSSGKTVTYGPASSVSYAPPSSSGGYMGASSSYFH